MGQSKIKQREGFPPKLIEEWEADDCVNFAVALARLTGWLLHVDWIVKSREAHFTGVELQAAISHCEDMLADRLRRLADV